MKLFKDLKRKKTVKTVRICPECKEPTLRRTTYAAFTNTENYECLKCGYKGSFYLEINQDSENEDNSMLERLKKEFPEFVEEEES